MGGLALLARGGPLWAALLVGIGVFANPMAFVRVPPFMLADVARAAGVRRRYLWFAALLAPFVAVRLVLGAAFSEPGGYLNETSQLMLYLGFALAGLALAGVNAAHPRRPFVILFLTYAAVCVLSFVTPGSPLGNNIGRFFFVFGLPLLFLLRHSRLQRPFPYGDLAVDPDRAVRRCCRSAPPYSHFTRTDEWPQTRARVLRPGAGRGARSTTTRTTASTSWRCAATGRPTTSPRPATPSRAAGTGRRTPSTTASSTRATTRRPTSPGCARMGVQYIFLADAPLDPWSRREVRILRDVARVRARGAAPASGRCIVCATPSRCSWAWTAGRRA